MGDFKRHNFKKLKIWQMGMEIANTVFNLTATFPASEQFVFTSQMNRCAISIPSNISEGSSRTPKSFCHFIDIALGSCFELQTQVLLACGKGLISEETSNELELKLEELQRATMSFQNTLVQS